MFLDIIADSHNYLYKISDNENHLIYRVCHESSPRIFPVQAAIADQPADSTGVPLWQLARDHKYRFTTYQQPIARSRKDLQDLTQELGLGRSNDSKQLLILKVVRSILEEFETLGPAITLPPPCSHP